MWSTAQATLGLLKGGDVLLVTSSSPSFHIMKDSFHPRAMIENLMNKLVTQFLRRSSKSWVIIV